MCIHTLLCLSVSLCVWIADAQEVWQDFYWPEFADGVVIFLLCRSVGSNAVMHSVLIISLTDLCLQAIQARVPILIITTNHMFMILF